MATGESDPRVDVVRRLPSRNEAAIPATKIVVENTTSSPSTNERVAATTHTAAGPAKGKRRRASSGRITSAVAGGPKHRGMSGASGDPA